MSVDLIAEATIISDVLAERSLVERGSLVAGALVELLMDLPTVEERDRALGRIIRAAVGATAALCSDDDPPNERPAAA